MIEPLAIPGSFHLQGGVSRDARGSFRKVFDAVADDVPEPFLSVSEVAISHNEVAGTVRGMHWQVGADAQTKIVWPASGSLVDVLVDVRPESPTYGRWVSVELSSRFSESILIPTGVAHGFQTLEDSTSVVYVMAGGYAPESARTLRWDDPTVAVEWPLPVAAISESDRGGAAWPVS